MEDLPMKLKRHLAGILVNLMFIVKRTGSGLGTEGD
jgi:hypothetical protein